MVPKDSARYAKILEGVTVNIDGGTVKVTGPKGTLERDLSYPNIVISSDGTNIKVDSTLPRKKVNAMIGTTVSHINNMIVGVKFGFEYKLKILYAHFPIQVKITGNRISIGNFLGERRPRTAPILADATVEVNNDIIIVSGINKEHVGQTAANIEQATKIKRLDPRVFQDGIYLVERGVADA